MNGATLAAQLDDFGVLDESLAPDVNQDFFEGSFHCQEYRVYHAESGKTKGGWSQMRAGGVKIGKTPCRRSKAASGAWWRGHGWRIAAGILVIGLAFGVSGIAGQEKQEGASQGLFLVARRGLADPLFAKTIVLMLPVKEGPLLVGLIVNRPTKVPLRDLFSDSAALQKRDATAYFGGPVDVEVGARSALFRSATAPNNATKVFGDVYVTFDPDTIAALLDNAEQAPAIRVFVGRAQWAPAQLQNEIGNRGWYSLHSGADPIFSKFPEAAWRTLLGRAEPGPLMKYEPPLIPHEDPRFGTSLHAELSH